jgi:two-component system heavy metal sensor histidine kinase CusS
MRSLRARLLVGIVCGMSFLLLIFSLIVYAVIHRTLFNQYDASLASTARILAASVELDKGEVELEFDVQQMPEFLRADRPTYYELWRSDGTVVARSPSLGANDLSRLEASLDSLVFRTRRGESGLPLRLAALNFMPRISDSDVQEPPQLTKEEVLTLVVARNASDLMGQLRFLRWLLLIASAAVITLSFLVAALIVRRGLRPLNRIAAEIGAITEHDLSTRVGDAPVPAEIAPIRDRLNDLLFRLQDAFNRERRFTGDVAHELRTPLAGIRSTIEVALTRNRQTDEYRTTLSESLAIAQNMQTMVDNLLMLARLDAQQISFRSEQIRLAELVNSCWWPCSDEALERQITFDNRIDPRTTCESDHQNLSIILSNVLANAVEYANEGGQIWTTACRKDGSAQIAVSNTGCQLNAEQASHVFDCFWRGDSSRKDAGVHCGLGLALVERIIRGLGGSASAEVQSGAIFTVRLTLPDMQESHSI